MNPAHEAMDDMAEAAPGINAKFAACHGPCDQGRRPCQTPEACHTTPAERMGPMQPWERFWLENPWPVAVAAAAVFMAILMVTQP